MVKENKTEKLAYEKAVASIVQFENSDVITTSGGGCQHWSNQNGQSCYYNLGEVY